MTPQQAEALAKATVYRNARAALHREVRGLGHIEGRERIAELLDDPPACIGTLPVLELLMWGRRIGAYQAQRILKGARTAAVSEVATLASATERQRLALARYLRGEREAEEWWP